MDITVHHTIELSGTTTLVLVLVAAIIAFALLYPTMIPHPVLSFDPPKGNLGFCE